MEIFGTDIAYHNGSTSSRHFGGGKSVKIGGVTTGISQNCGGAVGESYESGSMRFKKTCQKY
jgi:hypothetical protein